jgi:hypothetical protein
MPAPAARADLALRVKGPPSKLLTICVICAICGSLCRFQVHVPLEVQLVAGTRVRQLKCKIFRHDPIACPIARSAPAWNGVATSPSPFQSLSQGNEDSAVPKRLPKGPTSRCSHRAQVQAGSEHTLGSRRFRIEQSG